MTANGVINPKDPLPKLQHEAGKELYKRFGNCATGFQTNDVISAAANMIVNSLRLVYDNRKDAEARMAEIMGRSSQALRDCYDGSTGKRRNIFPHTQHILAAHHLDKDKR